MFDAASQLISETDAMGRTTLHTHDGLGREIETETDDPDGEGPLEPSVWQRSFNANSNLISTLDPLDQETLVELDNLGRTIKVTDAEAGETLYSFDAANNLLSLTDPAANTTTWFYDGLNRVIEEQNELEDSRYFQYDAASNLTQRTDRNGRVIECEYDALNRPTQERWMDGETAVNTISYTFDAASQLTAASDTDSAYAYTYDNIGRVLTVSNSGTSGVPTVVLTNIFDAASNRTRLSATVGGTADFRNDYTYDNLLRLTRIDQVGQSGGNTVADKRLDFSYDAASRLTSVARNYKSGGTWTEAATTAFSYDTIDRLTGIDHKRGGTSLFTAYAYTFDNADRITQIVSQDGTVDYSYDQTSQLVGADYTYQTDETFSFDDAGNRDMTGYTTGPANRMTSDGVYDYEHDAEGNLALRTKISDGSVTEYTWDHRNRLEDVTERDSAEGDATKWTGFVYDVYDRRIAKLHDADGDDSGSIVTTRYVYDGDATEVVLQFDGSNNIVKRDLWAEALGLVAEENASNAILWGLGDHLTTLHDVINNSGVVQNHIKWDAFHNVTSETAAAVDYLMGAAGMVRDEETGLHYAWHRYLLNGRWLGEDPIGFLAGDTNLARVVGNNVTNFIDPTGLVVANRGLVSFDETDAQRESRLWWERFRLEISIGMAVPSPGMLGGVSRPAGEGARVGLTGLFARMFGRRAPTFGPGTLGAAQGLPPRVLQTGGRTISEGTRRALGLSREQAKKAIEALKGDILQGAADHGHKILDNGDVLDCQTGAVLGNLFEMLQ